MSDIGVFPFRIGGEGGLTGIMMGAFSEMKEKVINLRIYRCEKCQKVEMFDRESSLSKQNLK